MGQCGSNDKAGDGGLVFDPLATTTPHDEALGFTFAIPAATRRLEIVDPDPATLQLSSEIGKKRIKSAAASPVRWQGPSGEPDEMTTTVPNTSRPSGESPTPEASPPNLADNVASAPAGGIVDEGAAAGPATSYREDDATFISAVCCAVPADRSPVEASVVVDAGEQGSRYAAPARAPTLPSLRYCKTVRSIGDNDFVRHVAWTAQHAVAPILRFCIRIDADSSVALGAVPQSQLHRLLGPKRQLLSNWLNTGAGGGLTLSPFAAPAAFGAFSLDPADGSNNNRTLRFARGCTVSLELEPTHRVLRVRMWPPPVADGSTVVPLAGTAASASPCATELVGTILPSMPLGPDDPVVFGVSLYGPNDVITILDV
jgi:hypothetical protein